MARAEVQWSEREVAVQLRIRELVSDPLLVGQPWAPELLAAADEADRGAGVFRVVLTSAGLEGVLTRWLVSYFGDRIVWPPGSDRDEFLRNAGRAILRTVRAEGAL